MPERPREACEALSGSGGSGVGITACEFLNGGHGFGVSDCVRLHGLCMAASVCLVASFQRIHDLVVFLLGLAGALVVHFLCMAWVPQ